MSTTLRGRRQDDGIEQSGESIIISCRTSCDFAACILDLESIEERLGARCAPVLGGAGGHGDGSGWARRTYEPSVSRPGLEASSASVRLAALANERAPEDAPLCLIHREGSAALVGAAHAVLAGKRVAWFEGVRSLGEAARGARSLTLVLQPTQVAALGTDTLHAVLAQAAPQARWGLLCASSAERLSELVARIHLRRLRPGRAVLARMADHRPLALRHIEHRAAPGHPSTSLATSLTEPLPLLMASGHGRTYCAIGGNLCSRSTPAPAGDTACVGGFDCVFAAWPRLPARDVRADVVFIDSCSTAGFRSRGPQAAEGLSVATHLLDGHATAVITASRTLCNDPATPYLLWHLLAAGERLGDATRVISGLLRARRGLLHPYVLLGDPEQRGFDAQLQASPLIVPERRDPGLWSLGVDVAPGRVQRWALEDPELARLAATQRRVACLVSPALAGRSRVELIPAGPGAAELLTAWDQGCPAGPARVLIAARPPFDEAQRAIVERVRSNARDDASWLQPDDQAARDRLEAEVTRHHASVLVSDGHTLNDGRRYAGLVETGQRLLAASEDVCRRLLARLLERSGSSVLWIYDHYQQQAGVRFDGEERSEHPCPYCGGEVHVQRLDIGLWPPRHRLLFECEACAVLGDAPAGHERPLVLRVPDRVAKGSPFTVEVEGQVTAASTVHVAPSFSRLGQLAEAFEFEPARHEQRTEGAQAFGASFQATVGPSLPTHMFHVQAMAVVDGAFLWAVRKVHLVDALDSE